MAIEKGVSIPVEFYPAPGSNLFDVRTPRNGTSLAASSAFTSLASFTVPGNTWGIFKGFGQGVATTAAWSNVEWKLQINGSPVSGYSSIFDQLSTLTRPIFLFREVQSGDLIDFLARNLSTTTAFVLYARILGWYYAGDSPLSFLYEQAHGEVG